MTGVDAATAPELHDDPPRPVTMKVTPAAVQLAALDSTAQLFAEIFDQNGQVVARPEIVWSSDSTSVAAVDGSGQVRAVGNGTATITADAGTVTGSVKVSVEQMVASVTVSPVSVALKGLGATVQLSADSFDQNGNPVAGAGLLWESGDLEVLTVGTGGLVTATGAGTATVYAAVGEVSGAATVTVEGFKVSGTVSDARIEGLPVPGVTVQLRTGTTDITRDTVTTDDSGQYQFLEVLGPVEVRVSAFPVYLAQSVQVTVDSDDRVLDLVLEHTGVPPYEGTVWLVPDILGPSDPTSLGSVTYVGRGLREVFDRRLNQWVTVEAYLFDVQFGERTVEFQVNPEFGSEQAARQQIGTFAPAIGRLPAVLVSALREVEMNAGSGLFGGNSYNRSILIHTDDEFTQFAVREGFLEEVFMHEAAHAALDSMGDDPGWLAAQAADAAFISEYARDYPNREDVAESFLPYFALRQRPDRLTGEDLWLMMATIPNRLEYFDQQQFDMSIGPPSGDSQSQ